MCEPVRSPASRTSGAAASSGDAGGDRAEQQAAVVGGQQHGPDREHRPGLGRDGEAERGAGERGMSPDCQQHGADGQRPGKQVLGMTVPQRAQHHRRGEQSGEQGGALDRRAPGALHRPGEPPAEPGEREQAREDAGAVDGEIAAAGMSASHAKGSRGQTLPP